MRIAKSIMREMMFDEIFTIESIHLKLAFDELVIFQFHKNIVLKNVIRGCFSNVRFML